MAASVALLATAWFLVPRFAQLQTEGLVALRAPSPAVSATPAPQTYPSAVPADTPLHVVGLGDSVPAATTEDPSDSYIVLVGEGLAERANRPARTDNLAVPGLTTVGLLGQLSEAPVRETVATADVVIITVGANDLDPEEMIDATAESASVSETRDVLTRVVDTVRGLAPQARIVLTGYWNVFAAGAVGVELGPDYVSQSDRLTREFNAMVETLALSEGVLLVWPYGRNNLWLQGLTT